MSKRWGRDAGGSPLAELLPGISQQMGLPLPPGAASSWTRVVGEGMARHCRLVSLRDGVLLVEADAPSWLKMLDEVRETLPERLASEGLIAVNVRIRLQRGG